MQRLCGAGMRCSDCAAAMDAGAVTQLHANDLYACLSLVLQRCVAKPNCALVSLQTLVIAALRTKIHTLGPKQASCDKFNQVRAQFQLSLSPRAAAAHITALLAATHAGQQASSSYEFAYSYRKQTQNAASETKSRFRHCHAAPAPLRHGVDRHRVGRTPDAGGPPGRPGATMLRRSGLR